MFEFCTDPSTLETFRWFACYLTNGAHFLFYQSFLVVFALLAVTAPTALAFGFAAAAASRSQILPVSWLGKIYTAMVRGVPDIVFFLFFILVLDQAIEFLRHSVVCPDWTDPIRQGANFIVCPEARTPQSGAPQWVHETYGFALAVFTYAIVFGAFCGNVLFGAMRAVPRAQLETGEEQCQAAGRGVAEECVPESCDGRMVAAAAGVGRRIPGALPVGIPAGGAVGVLFAHGGARRSGRGAGQYSNRRPGRRPRPGRRLQLTMRSGPRT